jgi:hypothetical protein
MRIDVQLCVAIDGWPYGLVHSRCFLLESPATAEPVIRLLVTRREERQMAKKTIHISDLSGAEIQDGKGATISIRFADARKGTYVLDVTDAEAEELGAKGRKQARRGRRPKAVET